MRIAIHTLGTRGDVQPYLALAKGLKSAGHEVLLVAPAQFEAFVGRHGIGFAALPRAFLDLLDTPQAKAAIAGSGGFRAGLSMIGQFRPIGKMLLDAEWEAARRFGPELIIYHPKAIGAPHIAEKLGCPAVLASPLPGFTPTRAFASPLWPFRSAGPLNRLTHKLTATSSNAIFRKMIVEWRVGQLDLPRRPTRSIAPSATLYAYSAELLPLPDDWPDNVSVTGYWFLADDENWHPSADLAAFIAVGRRPVYVGFGSMPGLAPEALTRLVGEALNKAGERGILATGGGALRAGSAGSEAFVIDNAPHDRLFPLLAACVHHGGAGTTAASVRAGKPTLICPFFGDQPFWGRRVAELRLGPRPLELRRLTADGLAAGIRQLVGQPDYARNAAHVGAAVGREDGVASAIGFLQKRRLLS